MKKFISLLGCVSLSACASEGVYSQNEALKDAIFQTPYSAVVKVTGFEKFSEHEEDVLFKVQAEVIQKLRGDVGSEITFSMYGELGDEPNIHNDPVILLYAMIKIHIIGLGRGLNLRLIKRIYYTLKKQLLT